ncbi:MAG: hypothetical protein RL698_833 [Pseudomonadota bacterium]|jgi:hypothetical protein
MPIDIRKIREDLGLRGDGSFEEIEEPIPQREAPKRPVEQPRLRDAVLEAVFEQMTQRLEAANAAARAEAARETRRRAAEASRGARGAAGAPGSGSVRRTELLGGAVEVEERIDADSISSGVRVSHTTFGVGVVRTVSRGKSRTNVTVEFDGAGLKRLLLDLAPMRILRGGGRG